MGATVGSPLQQALEAQDRQDHQAALALFHQALSVEPSNWVGHTGLGNSLRALGRLDDAVIACARAVELAEEMPAAWAQLGFALHAQGDPGRALHCLRRACALGPPSADAHNNVAVMALHAGEPADAEVAARQALVVDPRHVRATVNLGRALREQGRLDDAIAIYRRALAVEPTNTDAGWNLGLALLMEEQWAEGWAFHELRSAIPGPPSGSGVPLWDGRPLAGATVLVQAEKGLGDTIQFVRYLSLLKSGAGAGRVVVHCQPPLQQLLVGCSGLDEVVGRDQAPPPCDARIPMMSLPLRLGAFDPAASARPRYLVPDADLAAAWALRLRDRRRGQGPAIGIAWQGNPAYLADARRSVALAAWLPVLRAARARGITVFSLQKGPGSDQLSVLPANAPVDDLGPLLDLGRQGRGAFVDSAAVMANLDLVISTDTAVPHLAGALGTPVWLLLAHLPDWRWGRQGANSPWYPRMRVFRQRQAGDWAGLFADVAAALPGLSTSERT